MSKRLATILLATILILMGFSALGIDNITEFRNQYNNDMRKLQDAANAEASKLRRPDGTVDTAGPEYQKIQQNYNAQKQALRQQYNAKHPASQAWESLQKLPEGGKLSSTGSDVSSSFSDMDISGADKAAAEAAAKHLEGKGHKVTYDPELGMHMDHTTDTKIWEPGTPEQLKARANNAEGYTRSGSLEHEGISSPDAQYDPEGYVEDLNKKYEAAKKAGDTRTMNKAARKMQEATGKPLDPVTKKMGVDADPFESGETNFGESEAVTKAKAAERAAALDKEVQQAKDAARAQSESNSRMRDKMAKQESDLGNKKSANEYTDANQKIDNTKPKSGSKPAEPGKLSGQTGESPGGSGQATDTAGKGSGSKGAGETTGTGKTGGSGAATDAAGGGGSKEVGQTTSGGSKGGTAGGETTGGGTTSSKGGGTSVAETGGGTGGGLKTGKAGGPKVSETGPKPVETGGGASGGTPKGEGGGLTTSKAGTGGAKGGGPSVAKTGGTSDGGAPKGEGGAGGGAGEPKGAGEGVRTGETSAPKAGEPAITDSTGRTTGKGAGTSEPRVTEPSGPKAGEAGGPKVSETGGPKIGETGSPKIGETGGPKVGEVGAPKSGGGAAPKGPGLGGKALDAAGAAVETAIVVNQAGKFYDGLKKGDDEKALAGVVGDDAAKTVQVEGGKGYADAMDTLQKAKGDEALGIEVGKLQRMGATDAEIRDYKNNYSASNPGKNREIVRAVQARGGKDMAPRKGMEGAGPEESSWNAKDQLEAGDKQAHDYLDAASMGGLSHVERAIADGYDVGKSADSVNDGAKGEQTSKLYNDLRVRGATQDEANKALQNYSKDPQAFRQLVTDLRERDPAKFDAAIGKHGKNLGTSGNIDIVGDDTVGERATAVGHELKSGLVDAPTKVVGDILGDITGDNQQAQAILDGAAARTKEGAAARDQIYKDLIAKGVKEGEARAAVNDLARGNPNALRGLVSGLKDKREADAKAAAAASAAGKVLFGPKEPVTSDKSESKGDAAAVTEPAEPEPWGARNDEGEAVNAGAYDNGDRIINKDGVEFVNQDGKWIETGENYGAFDPSKDTGPTTEAKPEQSIPDTSVDEAGEPDAQTGEAQAPDQGDTESDESDNTFTPDATGPSATAGEQGPDTTETQGPDDDQDDSDDDAFVTGDQNATGPSATAGEQGPETTETQGSADDQDDSDDSAFQAGDQDAAGPSDTDGEQGDAGDQDDSDDSAFQAGEQGEAQAGEGETASAPAAKTPANPGEGTFDGVYRGSANGTPMTLHISGGTVSATLGEVTLSGSVDADGHLSATWSGITGSADVSYGETSGTIEIRSQLTLTGRVNGDSASGSLGVHSTAPGGYDESNSFNWQCSR